MALPSRIKQAALKVFNSKPMYYQKPPEKKKEKQVQLKVIKRKTTPPAMKQYGDRGYRPSTGRNVGP